MLPEAPKGFSENCCPPVGTPTAPQGKYSFPGETTAFPHQDLFHSTTYKSIRADWGDLVPECFVCPQRSDFFPFPEGDSAEAE